MSEQGTDPATDVIGETLVEAEFDVNIAAHGRWYYREYLRRIDPWPSSKGIAVYASRPEPSTSLWAAA